MAEMLAPVLEHFKYEFLFIWIVVLASQNIW